MAPEDRLSKSTTNANTAWMVGRWLGVVAAIAIMVLFWRSPLLWPLKIFVVLLHELSHTAALVLTGGHPSGISFSPDQSGVAWGTGGWRIVVLSAGYLGSLAWGLVLLSVAGRVRIVPWFLRAMGLALAAITIVWIRPVIGFGFAYGLVASAVLFGLGSRVSAPVGAAFLRVLGLFSCLYALNDILLDVLHPASWGHTSDATMLAELTGIPALLWGVAWTLAAVVILVLFRRTIVGGGSRR